MSLNPVLLPIPQTPSHGLLADRTFTRFVEVSICILLQCVIHLNFISESVYFSNSFVSEDSRE